MSSPSLVSMVKVEEFMETYVRDSLYEGSYKAGCSLTTDRNRNTRHRGHPHAVQRYNSHASRFYHHNWNSFICEAWPLHNMLCLILADLCFYVTQRCAEQLQDVWCWCMLLLFWPSRQRDTSPSSALKRWESSGWRGLPHSNDYLFNLQLYQEQSYWVSFFIFNRRRREGRMLIQERRGFWLMGCLQVKIEESQWWGIPAWF